MNAITLLEKVLIDLPKEERMAKIKFSIQQAIDEIKKKEFGLKEIAIAPMTPKQATNVLNQIDLMIKEQQSKLDKNKQKQITTKSELLQD